MVVVGTTVAMGMGATRVTEVAVRMTGVRAMVTMMVTMVVLAMVTTMALTTMTGVLVLVTVMVMVVVLAMVPTIVMTVTVMAAMTTATAIVRIGSRHQSPICPSPGSSLNPAGMYSDPPSHPGAGVAMTCASQVRTGAMLHLRPRSYQRTALEWDRQRLLTPHPRPPP